jgi:hypothetical protein
MNKPKARVNANISKLGKFADNVAITVMFVSIFVASMIATNYINKQIYCDDICQIIETN